jgi:PhoPQ-activated pathogenicity-related protein
LFCFVLFCFGWVGWCADAEALGYKHIVMAGLSGGGWTTTISAAIDPRITLSMPIAGSMPKVSQNG